MEKYGFRLVILAGCLQMLWLAWAFGSKRLASVFTGSGTIESAGQWGDSFGAFNALISSFGLIAVIATLRSQSRSIRQQDIAIRIQQDELKNQLDDSHRQRFDSTFFDLLKLLRECRNSVRYEINKFSFGGGSGYKHRVDIYEGIDAFEKIQEEILSKAKASKDPTVDDQHCRIYGESYHNKVELTISPYFRVIYRILDRIRRDKIITDLDKIEYSKLVRGQISSAELSILGLNANLEISNDMSELLTQFRILKYLPPSPIRVELEALMSEQAFAPRDD